MDLAPHQLGEAAGDGVAEGTGGQGFVQAIGNASNVEYFQEPAGSFRVSGPGGDYEYEYQGAGANTVPVNGIEAIVIDSLNRTGRFRLVERTELGSVLGEQDLAASGRVAAPSGAICLAATNPRTPEDRPR